MGLIYREIQTSIERDRQEEHEPINTITEPETDMTPDARVTALHSSSISKHSHTYKHAKIHIRHDNKAQTTLDHNPKVNVQYKFPLKNL